MVIDSRGPLGNKLPCGRTNKIRQFFNIGNQRKTSENMSRIFHTKMFNFQINLMTLIAPKKQEAITKDCSSMLVNPCLH